MSFQSVNPLNLTLEEAVSLLSTVSAEDRFWRRNAKEIGNAVTEEDRKAVQTSLAMAKRMERIEQKIWEALKP